MPTFTSWSTVVDHTTDAGFRAWGSEIGVKLALIGMVQTADTGQINWATVTRPAVSTAGGYEIWRLSGSALFFKIEYGTQSAAAAPGLWITVGTGSNGSGTITGAATSARTIFTYNTAPVSTATSYQSFVCANASYFGLCWKLGAGGTNTPHAFMATGLTVDGTGSPTNVGFSLLCRPTITNAPTSTSQTVRLLATAAAGNASTQFCLFPGGRTASADGNGNNQAYLHWLDTPAVIPSLWTASVIQTELAPGSTAVMTLVGATPHTYLSVGGAGNVTPFFRMDAGGSALLCAVMLYE